MISAAALYCFQRRHFNSLTGILIVAASVGAAGSELHQSSVDVWPSLDDAAQAATEPIIQALDELPRLEQRSYLMPLDGDRPTGIHRAVIEAMARGQFQRIEAGPEGLPRIEAEEQEEGQNRLLTIRWTGQVSSSAAYRDVPWAAGNLEPSKSGSFVVVVGRSDWLLEIDDARAEAARDAMGSLVLLWPSRSDVMLQPTDADAGIPALLDGAPRQDFQQIRKGISVQQYRVTSQFVVPANDLAEPGESVESTASDEWLAWTVAITVPLLIVLRFLWNRAYSIS